ncbi:hypothetical protein DIPPA_00713 [Diplonema papillatum]|nr:hypothetical protein DIPPA_00713 [Diplonema papillatum]
MVLLAVARCPVAVPWIRLTWIPRAVVLSVLQHRAMAGEDAGFAATLTRGIPDTDRRSVAAAMRAIDAPGNPLTVLARLLHAWQQLSDADLAEMIRELTLRQQRAAAASEGASVLAEQRRLSYAAREIFERAKKHKGVTTGPLSYTQLIVCFANCGSASLADAYFKEMKHGGLEPTALTYTAVVKALATVQHVIRLKEVVSEMKRAGIQSEPGADHAEKETVDDILIEALGSQGKAWVAAGRARGVQEEQKKQADGVRASTQRATARAVAQAVVLDAERGLFPSQRAERASPPPPQGPPGGSIVPSVKAEAAEGGRAQRVSQLSLTDNVLRHTSSPSQEHPPVGESFVRRAKDADGGRERAPRPSRLSSVNDVRHARAPPSPPRLPPPPREIESFVPNLSGEAGSRRAPQREPSPAHAGGAGASLLKRVPPPPPSLRGEPGPSAPMAWDASSSSPPPLPEAAPRRRVLKLALRSFIAMKDSGLVMDKSAYVALLRACVRHRSGVDAEGVVMMMREDRLPVGLDVLLELLRVHAVCGDPMGISMTLRVIERDEAVNDDIMLAALTGLTTAAEQGGGVKLEAAQMGSDLWAKHSAGASSTVLIHFTKLFCATGLTDAAELALLHIRRSGVSPPQSLVNLIRKATTDADLANTRFMPFLTPITPGI